MRAMEKDITPRKTPPGGPLDFASWRSFQKGLAEFTHSPVFLYDEKGSLLSASGRDNCVCSSVKSTLKGRNLCTEQYRRAAAEALETGKPHIYRCHTRQYIFAVPLKVDARTSFVIIGGRAYLEGRAMEDFYRGLAGQGLGPDQLEALRREMTVIRPSALFSMPDAVSDTAGPHLNCLFRKAPAAQAPGGDGPGYQALERMYSAIAPILERDQLYETILVKSIELVGAEAGSLMILDPKTNVLTVKAARGLESSLQQAVRVRKGEGIAGRIADSGRAMLVRDIEREVPARTGRKRYKTRSFVSIPLKIDSRVIGVLNITDKITGEVFSDDDLKLLTSFASYASIALERGAYYSMSEELKTISMTDPLTDLFNRRYFRERLYEEVERVKRHDERFSLFVIDIDNFKDFNDRYGHQAGDEILRGVSRAIRKAVRGMDVVARYGGEEFAALLPHTGREDAREIAERVRKGVEEIESESVDYDVPITISLGVAEFPTDAANMDSLIDKADKAMYRAKRTGKNRVVVYDGEDDI